jgi:hypothetical protein
MAWDGRVHEANSRFFVTARNGGALFTSENGVTWAQATSNTVADLFSVAYGNSTYVVGGDQMTVLTGR